MATVKGSPQMVKTVPLNNDSSFSTFLHWYSTIDVKLLNLLWCSNKITSDQTEPPNPC